MKKKIIYLSTNDGSDTRINKEIKTLSSFYEIIFLGVGKYNNQNFASEHCKQFYLIQGKRNTIFTMTKHVIKFLQVLMLNRIHSIHVINEQLMIFFYPFLFFHHVVLDLFDSRFLKYRIYGEKMVWLKKIVYFPTNIIIVTDKNREGLMPLFLKKKILILENYPYLGKENYSKEPSDYLTILFSGSLIKDRGLNLLQDLVKFSDKVKVLMAGWIPENENEVKDLIQQQNVEFLGVMTQQEIAEIAEIKSDYILCMYPPKFGLINASPNKVYDGIQCSTPVIINAEIKVSKFVLDNNIGYILPSYSNYNIQKVIIDLMEMKSSFSFNKEMKLKYSWEYIENRLLNAHKKI